ncbi:unnamed protein product [Urochloa decumbens]|uniref:FAF domain-containing protein n=1 Tax=Urochloa decumbens TaxID=240449 RepID=A0ABC8YGE1_9POAL
MSVAVCRGPVPPTFETPSWPLRHAEPPYKQPVEAVVDHRPAQEAVWDAIQQQADANKEPAAKTQQAPYSSKPYVHPLVRRSSRLMSQKSLEVCTESLGNETGSGDFASSLDDDMMACLFGSAPPVASAAAAEEHFFWQHDAARDLDEEEAEESEGKGLAAVNYHRSSAGAATRSPRRAFPPPLPSMSRRDGPCLQMRPRRQDGRLVIEAVAVRPRGYLHATRQGGRLRLSFVECCGGVRDQSKIAEAAAEAPYFPSTNVQEEEAAVEMEEDDEVVDEEEEEVEVVDRGTVVEVKVSTQPQTAAKVHRSTLVINKFVGGAPLSVAAAHPRCCHAESEAEAESSDDETVAAHSPRSTLRRVPSSTTSLAAAVAAASTGTDVREAAEDDDEECGGWVHHRPAATAAAAETKQQLNLLFTSRRGDKQDILQTVRQCRQLREKRLFILEPYCIATN